MPPFRRTFRSIRVRLLTDVPVDPVGRLRKELRLQCKVAKQHPWLQRPPDFTWQSDLVRLNLGVMTKKERAEFIRRRLEELYPEAPVPLRHADAYTLLIAVLLSAQCTDERVNKTTPALFARADTPEKMVELDPETIQEIIRPCGLAPAKARAIHGLSRILLERYAGKVPRTFEELESLPGVGHKTASVVMVQAFGVPAFPVDTHIHRLAQRWGLSSGRNVMETERDLKRLFPRESWSKLHLQIIYYGREHCTARRCDGTVCEICRTCFPRRRKPVATRR